MTQSLQGQIAIVTGAGRGIGRGCAEALAEAGAQVIAVARSAHDLAEVAAHPSGRIETWAADVTSDDFLARVEGLDGLSILVNNAGANRPQPFIDVDTESLDFVIDLNVRAAFRVAQAAARSMLATGVSGSIVHMSSQMGHVGSPNRSVYCMTKHAIEGLTKAMAVELAPSGIRVNSVAPGIVRTDMTDRMFKKYDPQQVEMLEASYPLGFGRPIDVARAVAFLGSDEAAWITGHTLVVDGGCSA